MHRGIVRAMLDDADRARKVLRTFIESNRKHGLSQRKLCEKAKLSPSAISQFLNGNAQSPKAETYERLASAASELLHRNVTVAELRGSVPAVLEIPVRSLVGAGDEIVPIETESPIYYVPAPPGMEDAEATEVRGHSMRPLYHDGDLLFHRRVEIDPRRFRDEVVVCQLKEGKRYVKLLQPGSRKGRYNLVSVNPAFTTLEDQQLLWVGPIEWVRKRKRV